MSAKLTEFSPAADIMECLLNAYCDLTDDDDSYVYDDKNYVSIGSVRQVVEQLRESES